MYRKASCCQGVGRYDGGMCGRIVVTRPVDVLAQFSAAVEVVAAEREPSWNVAPGAEILAVADTHSGRRLGTMRWGLVPSWSTDLLPARRHARVESILDKAHFAESLARRRCLVLIDGSTSGVGRRAASSSPTFSTGLTARATPSPWPPSGTATRAR